MNWKNEATQDLYNHDKRVNSLINMHDQIRQLKSEYTSIKTATTNSTPVQGGENKVEDKLLSNIVKRQRLELTYKNTKMLVDVVERGLQALDTKERDILTKLYINPCKGSIRQLSKDYVCDDNTIYRMRDRAIYKFTIAMYGIPEL